MMKIIRLNLFSEKVENIDNNPEGYHLLITKRNILIEANDNRGLFYGVQTLRQLLTIKSDKQSEIKIPAVEIYDYPKFKWRGLNLDCCRHFMSKEFIKRYIDLLAFQKMNCIALALNRRSGLEN